MIVRVIGWTLVHALWQCGALSLLLGGALALAKRSRAVVRYRLAASALAMALVLPVATAIVTTRAFDNLATMQRVDVGTGGVRASAQGQPDGAVSASAADLPDVVPVTEVALRPLQGTEARVGRWLRRSVESNLGWIVTIWLVGVAVRSARALGGWFRARALSRRGTRVPTSDVIAVARRVEAALGIHGPTRVVESQRVDVPFVVGVLRPIVVLPVSLVTSFPPNQLEMILAHELAHVLRRDVLANLLQTAVETLLFYHPAVWWISARMREEREHSCDELAIAACGGDGVSYTEALLALEEQRGVAPAFAMAATGGSLLRRAARVLTREPAYSDLGMRWAASVLTGAFVVAASGPAVKAAAQSVPAPRVTVIDSAKAQPRFVLTPAASRSLREHWRWADSAMRARGVSSYWIGYQVSRSGKDNEWYYLDQRTPVALGSESWSNYSTRVHFDGGDDLSGVRIVGASLAPHLGVHPAGDVAVLLGFTRSANGETRWLRTHIANFVFPMYFDDWPVAWLGLPRADESVEHLERLIRSNARLQLRGDLVAAIGLHSDGAIAAPPLARLLGDEGAPDQIRSESADWLGHHATAESITALAASSRREPNMTIRKHAVFAFAHMRYEPASDTLRLYAETLDQREARLEAVNGLGHRFDDATVAFLAARARTASDANLRDAYIDALANMERSLGLSALVGLTQTGTDAALQRKAVEALGGLDDENAVAALLHVAQTHADTSTQRLAAEALGGAHPHEPAIAALLVLGRAHRLVSVRQEAVDGLASFDDEPAATAALRELSRSAPDTATRARAAEALRDR